MLELRYGHGLLTTSLPPGVHVEEWSAPSVPGAVSQSDLVAHALDQPIAAAPLARVARGARRVSILISGNDRVAGARIYLPVILDRLAAAGVDDDRVEIVCATGTHMRHSPQDVRALVGEGVAARVRFRAHDCDGPGAFADLGCTSFGTPVQLDRGVADADLRILTGRITHHYFAGFSGGRKSILPGVAARPTILANHRRVLEFSGGCRVHPGVFGGNLVGNPVHEDMVEAARKLGPCFVLNTLLDAEQRVSGAYGGELEAAHQAGCDEAERTATFDLREGADLVLASPGGYPADINFIQSVKTLFNHPTAARRGGVFVLVAEAAGGVLAGMKEWMAMTDREALGRVIESRYNLAAHNSLMLQDLLETVHVVAVSRLPADDIRGLGLVPAGDLAGALEAATALLGRAPSTIRVIHHGNVTQSSLRRGSIHRREAMTSAERGTMARG